MALRIISCLPVGKRLDREVALVVHGLNFFRRLVEERVLAGEQLHERHAQRINVHARIQDAVDIPNQRLGTHVGACSCAGVRDAEIRKFQRAVFRDQHVVRLDVVVDDFLAVNEIERLSDGLNPVQRLGGGDFPTFDGVAHAATGAILHDKEQQTVFRKMVMIGDDVRMVELRNHLHFVNDGGLTGGVLTVQLLDGDAPMGNILAGEKHRAKAAFAQLAL